MTMTQRQPAVTRAEFEALQAEIEQDREVRAETHALVIELHTALMKPAPGQDHSLLHRMAVVTISAETGQAVGNRLIRMAKIVSAVGAICAGALALVGFGHEVPK